jgi:hypothetical protein
MTVGVVLSREKADKGAETVLPPRKTRRGQRGGASGLARIWLDREASRLVVSAVRSAAPTDATPALKEKPQSARRVNHQGRKHLWAVRASNRLAARKPVAELIKEMPWDFGHMSRSEAKRFANVLGVGSDRWNRFRDWWHEYSYKCRHIGCRPEGRDPLHFLALRSPKAGVQDLEDLVFFNLPRPGPPRIRFCRATGCGRDVSGLPDHMHCSCCRGSFDFGHNEDLCRHIRQLELSLGVGASSKRRRRRG